MAAFVYSDYGNYEEKYYEYLDEIRYEHENLV